VKQKNSGYIYFFYLKIFSVTKHFKLHSSYISSYIKKVINKAEF